LYLAQEKMLSQGAAHDIRQADKTDGNRLSQ
jgi:hypothetical protein